MDNGISLQTKGTYSSVQGKLNLIQSTDSYLLYIVKNVKVICQNFSFFCNCYFCPVVKLCNSVNNGSVQNLHNIESLIIWGSSEITKVIVKSEKCDTKLIRLKVCTWLNCIERWWLQQTVLEELEKGEFKWVPIFVRNASWQKKESSTFIYK